MGSTEENSLLLTSQKTWLEILLPLTKKLLPPVFLLILVAVLYLLTIHFYYEFNAINVPRGDPFSYTINWFNVITEARGHYWQTLGETILGRVSWYQLQAFLVTLFSPLLTLNPARICIVNFFSFFVATFFWYRLASLVLPNRYLALACSLLYWFLPSHYGVYFPVALFTLQLDTMFFNIYCAAVAAMLIYSLDPKLRNAVWAAIMISLAIWGRGNALPYVLIGAFVPALILLKSYLNANNRLIKNKIIINISILFIIVLVLAYFYYKHYLDTIFTYYAPHYHIVRHSFVNWSNIFEMARKVPGIFIKFAPTSYVITIWTILIHLFMIATALIILIKPLSLAQEQRIVKILCTTGLFIFYSTLFAIVCIFNASSFILWHPYAPMLVGLYLELLAIVLYFLFLNRNLIKKITLSKFVVLLVAMLALMYGYILSNKQTIAAATDSPSPKQVIFLATHMEQLFGNSSIAFLWSATYNEPIITYYRLINGLPAIPMGAKQGLRFYNNTYWPDIWEPTVQVNRQRLKKGLQETVAQADYIVVPDCISTPNPVIPYNPNQFYPLYLNKNLITEVFDSPSTPRFKVKMVLHEAQGIRLLVLQRLNENNLSPHDSDLLPRPFPEYPRCRKLTYHNAYIN